MLAGRVSLGEFEPVRERAEVVSIAPDSAVCWYKCHQRHLHPVLGEGPARSWALWGSALWCAVMAGAGPRTFSSPW